MTLESCLRRQDIWRSRKISKSSDAVATGFEALDHRLPGGGWPKGALTEILVENVIRSPLWLILPMLAALTTLRSWQAWINPPALPYPPGLDQSGIDLSKTLLIETKDHAEILWSAEQALRSRACSAVICWPSKLTQTEMRRLQLAAEGGDTLGIFFRNETALRQHSMATLRMRCYELPNGMEIDFLKCRGGPLHQNISIHRLRGNTSVTINT